MFVKTKALKMARLCVSMIAADSGVAAEAGLLHTRPVKRSTVRLLQYLHYNSCVSGDVKRYSTADKLVVFIRLDRAHVIDVVCLVAKLLTATYVTLMRSRS